VLSICATDEQARRPNLRPPQPDFPSPTTGARQHAIQADISAGSTCHSIISGVRLAAKTRADAGTSSNVSRRGRFIRGAHAEPGLFADDGRFLPDRYVVRHLSALRLRSQGADEVRAIWSRAKRLSGGGCRPGRTSSTNPRVPLS